MRYELSSVLLLSVMVSITFSSAETAGEDCAAVQQQVQQRCDMTMRRVSGQAQRYKALLSETETTALKAQESLNVCRRKLARVARTATPPSAAVPGGRPNAAVTEDFVAVDAPSRAALDNPTASQTSCAPSKRRTGLALASQPHYTDPDAPGAGPKADQAVSPLAFPSVPGSQGRNWLRAHIDYQYGVLQRLYTANALTALDAHERQNCRSSQADLYCRMQVRLYWIGQGLTGG